MENPSSTKAMYSKYKQDKLNTYNTKYRSDLNLNSQMELSQENNDPQDQEC